MTLYRVSSAAVIPSSDPLHVGRFYPGLERRHHQKMRDRQDLILYLANIHFDASGAAPRGFRQVPMRLTSLKNWVYDYRVVFDHFFEIVQLGYNLGEKNDISYVIPREIPSRRHPVKYVPPVFQHGVKSRVFIQQQNAGTIRERLAATGRFDLQAPVEFLLEHPEINFYFQRAGKLQLRDSSTWPISAIETWPSWLRQALFGPGIDIETAYTQFLIEHVRPAYVGREHLIELLYPDLLRLLNDKTEFRRELCCDLLGIDYDDDNLGVVKKICMSIANGSRISPAILTGNANHSITKDLIMQHVPDTSSSKLNQIGERLQNIARQFGVARKLVCSLELELKSSRQNQKQVFVSYFEWERLARYKIWEAVGRHGIMVHDGIDGVPEKYLRDVPELVKSLNIKLSAS